MKITVKVFKNTKEEKVKGVIGLLLIVVVICCIKHKISNCKLTNNDY